MEIDFLSLEKIFEIFYNCRIQAMINSSFLIVQLEVQAQHSSDISMVAQSLPNN